MFKLESYITPLILSYVDKYIKNLKPEDSQVSLWGGDAVFNNLDLRLDVLEDELRMPFSFVNGHIHELRIHVPWTKLGSEPVVITINTIECILKLCEGCDNTSSTEGSSVRSSGSLKVRGDSRSGAKRSESPGSPDQQSVVPPSYVQSLINRVVNNISVVCNNVVLKYVEDDIVLSLNVKSVEAFSADDRWERAFVDLSLPQLVLRKLIRLQDLTVCLDRRNASGRIDAYQEPLLYRCSLDCRLHLRFESLYARHLLAIRLDVLCDCLDISVTNRQLLMFLRLIELCLALHADEIGAPPPRPRTGENDADSSGSASTSPMALEGRQFLQPEQQGWGAWMWSYVPSGLTVWDEEQEGGTDATQMPPPVIRFGLYINQASFVFKVVEPPDPNGSFGIQKISYQPLCCLHCDGVFVDLVLRGIDALNVRFGIVKLLGVVAGQCPCGVRDCSGGDGTENHFLFGGLATLEWTTDYLHDSLFDPLSLENVAISRREYCFDWEDHLTRVSLTEMQARSPAFAVDYFYLLEIPEDVSDKSSGRSNNDLDSSNLKERASVRMTIGPAQLDLTSSVAHRVQFIQHCAEHYDYEPYSKAKDLMVSDPLLLTTQEEVLALEACMPSRSVSVHVMQPIVRIFVQNHPSYDAVAGPNKVHHSRESYNYDPKSTFVLPALLLYGDRVDVHRTYPMFLPERVMKIASVVRNPSENLLHQCHNHFSLKVSNCSAVLRCDRDGREAKSVIIQPCSLTLYKKMLLLPSFWKNPLQPHCELMFEVERFACNLTAAQLMLLQWFHRSWFDSDWRLQQLADTSLVKDAFFLSTNTEMMEFVLTNVNWKQCNTGALMAFAGSIMSIEVKLIVHGKLQSSLMAVNHILRGPEPASICHSIDFFSGDHTTDNNSTELLTKSKEPCDWLSFTVQFSKDIDSIIGVPSVFLVHVKNMACCLDPRVFRWFSYQPRHRPTDSEIPGHYLPKKNELQSKVSGMSSTTPTLLTGSQAAQSNSEPKVGSPDGGALNLFTQLVADWYPMLCSLNLHFDVEGFNIFLPVDHVPWGIECHQGILEGLRQMHVNRTLPPLLVVNLPHIVVSNDIQRHPSSLSGIFNTACPKIPIGLTDGYGGLACDHFPWDVAIENYSFYVIGSSPQPPQYCVSPSSLSATVAVNSKSSPAASGNLCQYSVCIHCDFQPIQVAVSKIQSQLISVVAKNILSVLPSMLYLLACYHGDGVLGSEHINSSPFDVASAVSPSATPMSPAEPKSKKPGSKTSFQTDNTGGTPLTSSIVEAGAAKPVELVKQETQHKAVLNSEGAKVSLWLQITLPKVKLIVTGEQEQGDLRLEFDLEDITSSIDVQEVYSKVKLKVTSMNASNYSKQTSDADWQSGPFEGITFCCMDRLTKNVYMPNPKTGIKSLHPHGGCFDSHDPQSQTSPAQGSFLLLTFTRAQCKNAAKRWSKILRDCSGTDIGLKLHNMYENSMQGGAHTRYISELDLKVTSFDVVFWAPLIGCVARVLMPLVDAVALAAAATRPKVQPSVSAIWKTDTCPIAESHAISPDDMTPSVPSFSNASLPLLYLNCGTIRIFLPRLDAAAQPEVRSQSSPQERTRVYSNGSDNFSTCTVDDRPGFKHHLRSARVEDFVVVQVNGITLTHNVENPLSRVILKQDIYNIAQRAGILSLPGSEVEDRQYQLDLFGLSLSTGSWSEMIQFGYRRHHCPGGELKLRTMGENPALEWNSKIVSAESDDLVRDVVLCPLVSQFDLHVTAAPAIVFQKSGPAAMGDLNSEGGVLISGHSLEVNATTDIEFYIGLHQIALLSKLTNSNLEELERNSKSLPTKADTEVLPASTNGEPFSLGKCERPKEPRDSGIESQGSTLSFLRTGSVPRMEPSGTGCRIEDYRREDGRDLAVQLSKSVPLGTLECGKLGTSVNECEASEGRTNWSATTPFEVLLTAGNIAISVYSPEHLLGLAKVSRKLTAAEPTKVKGHKLAAKKRSDLQWREQHSSSTEESPVRRKAKAKGRSTTAPTKKHETSDETAGYEGSEESLDEAVADEELEQVNAGRIVPLIHLHISQPYSFLKCHQHSQKIELSSFDVSLKGTSSKRVVAFNHLLPRLEDYDSPWLETLPGDVNPKTGIPPALYTLAVANFFVKPDVAIKIERPLKINFGVRHYENMLGYWCTILDLCCPLVTVDNTQGVHHEYRAQSDNDFSGSSVKRLSRRCRSLLTKMERLSCHVQQLIFVLEAGGGGPVQTVRLHLCFSEALAAVDFNRVNGIFSDADNAHVSVQVDGCMLKAEVGEKLRPLIGPLSLSTGASIVWENWCSSDALPRLLAKLDVELLLIHFDQENLGCLKMVVDHFFPSPKDEHSVTGKCQKSPAEKDSLLKLFMPSSVEGNETVSLQTWQDDLRIGVFQYTQDADDTGLIPGPNEIVFSKGYSEAGRPASMTWRYPQPRSITVAEIHPVPFRAASGTTPSTTREISGITSQPETTEVLCALQYWDALPSRFTTYRVFRLSETQHCRLEMPPASVETCRGEAVVSPMWRVLMDYEDDPTVEEEAIARDGGPRRSLVSPLALAACMRVDSCFFPGFVPFFEGLVNLGLVKITLGNHFPSAKVTDPLRLAPYELDGAMPEHQEFLFVCLENVLTRNRHWHRGGAKLDIDAVVTAEIMDYRFLVLQQLLEPFSVKGQLLLNMGSPRDDSRGPISVCEASVSCTSLYLHLTPSALHTLSMATRAWKDGGRGSRVDIMNGYLICNDTGEKLRFGQVDTDESVGLCAHQAAAYSWRTHKRRRVMQVCMEPQWKWCEPFAIDAVGTQVRTIGGGRHRPHATLLVRVLPMNGNDSQKKVIISGQLVVANRLIVDLEVRLDPAPTRVALPGEDRFDVHRLAARSRLPSFVVPHEDSRRTLKIRLADSSVNELRWSCEVDVDSASLSPRGMLMRVPGTTAGDGVCCWCHVFRKTIDATAIQTLVLFAPLYIVRTHLPLPLSLEVTTPALNRSMTVNVDGRSWEHQLCCPGEPDLTHQLSFGPSDDAEGGAAPSNNNNPPLPLSPSMIAQAEHQPPLSMSDFDIDALSSVFDSSAPLLWPYSCEDLERELEALPLDLRAFVLRQAELVREDRLLVDGSANYYQPKIDLEVCLRQRWAGCSTLLVDVKPWALLDNRSGIKVFLTRRHEGTDENLQVPAGVVFALPRIQGTFKIGVSHQDRVFYSNSIELASDDWSLNRYWPRVRGVLQVDDGHVLCEIFVASTTCRPRTCLLVMSARRCNGIRVFTLHPYYTVVNASQRELALTAYAIANDELAPSFRPQDPEEEYVVTLATDTPTSLLFVETTDAYACNRIDGRDEIGSVHYVRFSGVRCPATEESKSGLSNAWSRSIRLKHHPNSGVVETDWVRSAAVPCDCEGGIQMWPFRITAHLWKGLMFLVIREDAAPQLVLHNNCSFNLNYGQGTLATMEEEFSIYEESDLVDEVPLLPARSSHFYTFPFVDDKFPELYEPQLLPKLHLASHVNDEDAPRSPVWSNGIDLFTSVDQFLNVPNCGDIKVHIERHTPTIQVFLDPVNRVEISAKEVRSRIKVKGSSSGVGGSPEHLSNVRRGTTKLKPRLSLSKANLSPRVAAHLVDEKIVNAAITDQTPSRRAGDTHSSNGSPSSSVNNVVNVGSEGETFLTNEKKSSTDSLVSSPVGQRLVGAKRDERLTILCYGTLHVKQVCVVLTERDAELLRVNLDDVYATTRPLSEFASDGDGAGGGGSNFSGHRTWIPMRRQEVVVCVGDVQMDNQRHAAGGYDFPVVLIRQDPDDDSDRPAFYGSVAVASASPWDISRARRESRIVVMVALQRSPAGFTTEDGEGEWWASHVDVTVKPVAIYLEDSLLYAVSRYIHSHVELGRHYRGDPLEIMRRDRCIPEHVRLMAVTLGSPLHVQRLTVQPISLLLSVHASLKLFLSLDHTPLSFGEFQRQNVSTTWYRLGHVLARHYLSGALFRAGWVLGSLDLLANPGGLARALGRGVADFVRLPYRGLLLGPMHFASGVLHGSSSLLRHSGAGTLMSLTNLASSVSRNMDRLSMDRSHQERNEEIRRIPPVGVAQGLTHGLTGLGISLLGAVAGIVDQPLQSIHGDPDQSLSPTAAAAGIISGVGKGLVGIVTKPIGGAAELVAQAGQGLLHGVGWAKVLKCRYTPVVQDPSLATNSLLKYIWKMLPCSPPDARIFAVEATHINASGHYVAAILLLTDEVLFVVSIESDAQQQAFPLAELDCRGHSADPTLVFFMPRPTLDLHSTQPEDKNRDRITEFIDKSSKYMLQNRSRTDESECLSDSSSSQPSHTSQQSSGNHANVVATQFFINPRLRNTFLTLYKMAQRKQLGKGYPM